MTTYYSGSFQSAKNVALDGYTTDSTSTSSTYVYIYSNSSYSSAITTITSSYFDENFVPVTEIYAYDIELRSINLDSIISISRTSTTPSYLNIQDITVYGINYVIVSYVLNGSSIIKIYKYTESEFTLVSEHSITGASEIASVSINDYGDIILDTEDGYFSLSSGYSANAAPTLATSATAATDADTALSVATSLLGTDADGDTIKVTAASTTSDNAIVVADGENGLLVIYTGSLAEGETATVDVTYTLSDGTDATSGSALTVTVTGTGSSTLNLTFDQLVTLYKADYSTITSLGGVFTAITVSADSDDLSSISTYATAYGALTVDLTEAASITATLAGELIKSGLVFADGDVVTVSDTGANLAAMTTDTIASLGTIGVSAIDASGSGAVTFTYAQYSALVTAQIALTADDTVTVTATADEISALSTTEIAALGTYGVDIIDIDGDTLTLTNAQYAAFESAGISFDKSDTINRSVVVSNPEVATDADTALTVATSLLGTDADKDTISVSTASVTSDNAIVIADGDDGLLVIYTGSLDDGETAQVDISYTLSDGTAETTGGELTVTVTGTGSSTLNLTFDQAVTLYNADYTTLASIGGPYTTVSLTADSDDLSYVSTYGTAYNVSSVDLSDDKASITVALAESLIDAGIAFDDSDTITVADTSGNLAALTTTKIASLATLGVTSLNASDDAVSLTVAQAQALIDAGIAFATGDTVTISDTAENIEAMDADDVAALAGFGISTITASDEQPGLSLIQINALADADMSVGYPSGEYVAASSSDTQIGTTTSNYNTDLTALTGGGYAVSWTAYDSSIASYVLYVEVFDASGAVVKQATRIATSIYNYSGGALIALSDGGFAATWQNYGQTTVTLATFSAAGDPVMQKTVNDTTGQYVSYVSTEELADGNLVTTWTVYGRDTRGTYGVYMKIVDPDGDVVLPETLVNTYTSTNQSAQEVITLDGGGFAIVWISIDQDGSGGYGVYMKVYDASGNEVLGKPRSTIIHPARKPFRM